MGRMAELHYALSLLSDQLPDYDIEDENKDELLIGQHEFQEECLSDEIDRIRQEIEFVTLEDNS